MTDIGLAGHNPKVTTQTTTKKNVHQCNIEETQKGFEKEARMMLISLVAQ